MNQNSEPMEMVAPPPVAEEPQLGFFGKLWNLYVDPRRTFASIKPNHEWIILWILVAAISIGAYIPIKGIIKQSQMDAISEQLKNNPQVPEARRAEILEQMESRFDNPVFMLFVPAFQIVVLFVVAGVLLFLGNIILGGNCAYLKMLNAYAWTMMIVIPGTIVTVPLVMAKGSMDVSIGLGVLTSADTGAFLKKLISSFELFALWQVWLSSVAVSVLAHVPAKKALGAVFVSWLIWVVVQGGLATLGVQFGGA